MFASIFSLGQSKKSVSASAKKFTFVRFSVYPVRDDQISLLTVRTNVFFLNNRSSLLRKKEHCKNWQKVFNPEI